MTQCAAFHLGISTKDSIYRQNILCNRCATARAQHETIFLTKPFLRFSFFFVVHHSLSVIGQSIVSTDEQRVSTVNLLLPNLPAYAMEPQNAHRIEFQLRYAIHANKFSVSICAEIIDWAFRVEYRIINQFQVNEKS